MKINRALNVLGPASHREDIERDATLRGASK